MQINTEHQVLKALLSKSFHDKNRRRIPGSLKVGMLKTLLETIDHGHSVSEGDLNFTDLAALHTAAHPTATDAEKGAIAILVENISEQNDIQPEVCEEVMTMLWRRDAARRVSAEAMRVWDGDVDTFEGVKDILGEGAPKAFNGEVVSTDIDDLLASTTIQTQFKFNIIGLASKLSGIGPGNFMIIFARPEMGKTAAWVTLAYGPKGWASQGWSVHALCNEEPAVRTVMRGVNCYTGLTFEEIKHDPHKARKSFASVKDNIVVLQDGGMTIAELDEYCTEHKPDILVVDQLDKLVAGRSSGVTRDDLLVADVYIGARRIAIKHNLLFVAITQASYEANNKTYIDYSMMADSRTGKAAEGDLIVGVSRMASADLAIDDDGNRTISVSKNKVNGAHGLSESHLLQPISRFEVLK